QVGAVAPQVFVAVVQDQLQANIRPGRQEGSPGRRQQAARQADRRQHPQRALDLVEIVVQRGGGLLQGGQQRPALLVVLAPFRGRLEAAGAAQQQLAAQPGFQFLQPAGQGGGRQLQPARRRLQAAIVHDGDEQRQVVEHILQKWNLRLKYWL